MPDEATRGLGRGARDDVGEDSSQLRRIVAWLLDETRRLIVMFLYLWVILGVFVLHERIVLHSRSIDVVWDGFAVINALVLAKVMLIAEDLNLGRWLPRRPLIYPILHDALLLTLLFIGFHFVERAIVGLFRNEAEAGAGAIGGGGIEGLLSVAVILFVSLIPFFAFRNVSRELGNGQLEAMLLHADRK